jgi:cellobiose phosphorylase
LLYNTSYSLVIAQNGIGFSTQNNLTEPVTVASQQSGRYLYIRDNDTGEFWSATWYPVVSELDQFRATHRLGMTAISAEKNKISSQIAFSVHDSSPYEHWQVQLTNTDKRKRRLSVFAVVEWGQEIQDSQFHDNAIVAITTHNETNLLARIFTLDHAVDSFDCDWDQFVGRYGSLSKPKALLDGKCSRSFGGDNRIAVLQKNFTLGAGTEANFAVILGVSTVDTTAQAKRLAKKWGKSLHSPAQPLPERVVIKSPEHDLNLLVNHWSKLQALSPISEYAAISERLDRLSQLSTHVPEQTKTELVEILSQQYRDGSLIRSITEPIPDGSVATVSKLLEALCSYLAETGDLSLLSEHVSFFDSGSGSTTEHLTRSCNSLLENLNSDSSALVEKSVAVSALRKVLPIFMQIGEHQFVRKIERAIDDQSSRINRQWARNPKQHLTTMLPILASHTLTKQHRQSAVNNLRSELKTITFSENEVLLTTVVSCVEQLAMHDHADDALELLEHFLPTTRSKSAEQYQAEPYLFPRSILASAQRRGQADSNLDNAAAAKFLSVITETVLGIQPTIGGLKIDPHIPRSWRQYEVSREFRGAIYHIRVSNPLRVTSGVSRLSVNGLHITGNVIRPFQTGNHFIEVTLG